MLARQASLARVASTSRSSRVPALATHAQGLAAIGASNGVSGITGIETNGRLVFVGNVSGQTKLAIKDSGAAWVVADVSGAVDDPQSIFADSEGNVLFSIVNDAQVFRLAAGATTPTLVLSTGTSPAMTAATDITTFAEDDQGTIWASEYSVAAILWKSTDRGLTWTKAVDGVFPGSGFTPGTTHMHGVFWDPWRKLLYASPGDGGAQWVQISADYGETWTSWVDQGPTQITGMLIERRCIWMCADTASDRDIYRVELAATATAEDVAASTAVSVFSPPDHVEFGNVGNEFGHCWAGRVNTDGYRLFPYGSTYDDAARLVAIGDDDVAHLFEVPLDGTFGVRSYFSWRFAQSESRTSDWDYGELSGLGFRAWRIMEAGDAVKLSASAGGEPHIADGRVVPYNAPVDYGHPHQVAYQLLENLADTFNPSLEALEIDKNGYDWTGSVTSVAERDQDCEGDPLSDSWLGSATTVALQDTTVAPAEGTYSVRLVSTTSTAARVQRVAVFDEDDGAGLYANPDIWMAYSQYVSALSWGSGDNTALSVSVSVSGEYVRLVYNGGFDPGQRWRVRSTLGGDDIAYYLTREPDLEALAEQGRWVRWKLHVKRHLTDGRIRIWQDGDLLCDIQGLNTTQSASGTTWVATAGFSPINAATTMTINIDDIRCRYADPDDPSGLTLLAGKRQVAA